MRVRLTVNEHDVDLDLDPGRVLADVLRADCGLTSVRHGCADGTCGGCTVLVDGRAIRSCLMLAAQGSAAHVRTVEGLPDDHPARAAVRAAGGARCAACEPGLVMLVAEVVAGDPVRAADPGPVRRLLAANVCRCPPSAPFPSTTDL